MDHMNGTELNELLSEQRAARDAVDAAWMRRQSWQHRTYLGRAWRVEDNHDAQYGAEWCISEAALLADENATLTAQLTHYDSMRTRHTLLQIANDDLRGECASLKRELEALREERDTLAAKLDAANAKLAALENAALVAEQDVKDVCAGFSAAHWYREVTALRNENDQIRKQLGIPTSADLVVRAGKRVYPLASQADAHEDDDDATPATLGDKPRKVWTEDVKRAILTALVEEPRNLSEMRADGWMAEVPDRQFAACILEMSRTWQLMRPVPGAPEGTYELTPDGADSARAMLADADDADDDAPVTLGDRKQQEARAPQAWTPPTRSKPDAAA